MGISEDIKQTKFKSELSKAVINLIYTNNWLGTGYLSLLKPYGLTTPQFNILRILRGQHPNPATINMLIDRMLDKSSNASRIVDKLESKGMVARQQCKDDRRAVDVIITEKALQVLEELDVEIEKWESDFMGLSIDDCRQLNTLLDKMRSISNKTD